MKILWLVVAQIRQRMAILFGTALLTRATISWAASSPQKGPLEPNSLGASDILNQLTLTPFIVGGAVGLFTFFMLEAGRLLTRPQPQHPRDSTARRNFWILLLFLVPLWFYLLAYHLSPSSLWYAPAVSAAGAFLVLGVLALWLEIRQIAGVPAADLVRRLLSRNYLQELTVPELTRLKRDLDEILLLPPERRLPDGLYQFLETVHERALFAPCRVGYEEYTSVSQGEGSLLLAECITRYSLAITSVRQEMISVSHQAEVPVALGVFEDASKYIHRLSLKVGGEIYIAQPGGDGDLVLVPTGGSGPVVPIESELVSAPSGQKFFRYGFTCQVPRTGQPPDEMIPVEISEKKVLPQTGLFVRAMPAATHGATLVFTFPAETETQVAVLANADDTWEVVKAGGSEVVLSCRHWLLPGHGAVVAWRLAARLQEERSG